MKRYYFFIFLVFLFQGFSKDANVDFYSEVVSKEEYKIVSKNETRDLKIQKKRGDFATGSIFRDDEINWAKRFNIAELGGIDDEHITYELSQEKKVLDISHHIAYDWMPAFYYYVSGKNREFISYLYEHRSQTTLNPNGPYPHCKKHHYDWCQDYYYNLGSKDVLKRRVDDLIMNMKRKGFNGIFFDWASGGYILEKEYKPMYENFKKLNPNKDYFKVVSNLYKTLKEKGIFFITNQAFRKDSYLLPYITYDMTESYITTDEKINKKIQIKDIGWVDKIPVTNYYPIYKNSNSLKDSLHFIDLLTKLKEKYKKYGFKNFIYMNYLAPKLKKTQIPSLYEMEKPKNGIYFSYAMAKLTDNIVYAEVPFDRKLERDDVYFYNLGKPLGNNYLKLNAIDAYVRFYQNGFVLASEGYSDKKYIKIFSSFIPDGKFIYDAYNQIWIKSKQQSVVIRLDFQKDTFSNKPLPLGRVFLYAK